MGLLGHGFCLVFSKSLLRSVWAGLLWEAAIVPGVYNLRIFWVVSCEESHCLVYKRSKYLHSLTEQLNDRSHSLTKDIPNFFWFTPNLQTQLPQTKDHGIWGRLHWKWQKTTVSSTHCLQRPLGDRWWSHKGPGDTVSPQTKEQRCCPGLMGFILITSLDLHVSNVDKKSLCLTRWWQEFS